MESVVVQGVQKTDNIAGVGPTCSPKSSFMIALLPGTYHTRVCWKCNEYSSTLYISYLHFIYVTINRLFVHSKATNYTRWLCHGIFFPFDIVICFFLQLTIFSISI